MKNKEYNQMTKQSLFMLSLVILLLIGFFVYAQDTEDDFAYTVGTTYQNTSGQIGAYIAWQAFDGSLLRNKDFAIYGKDGPASSIEPFNLLSVVSMQTDPTTLEYILALSDEIGQDVLELEERISQLFEGLLPQGSSMKLGDKLASIMHSANDDLEAYSSLLFLGRYYPALNICLGFGYHTMLPDTGYKTFEVREYDSVGQKDLRVIGRVTLSAEEDYILPAPGRPVEIPELSGKGDLNVRLRWAASDALKELTLLQFGYHLYRIPRALAEDLGFDERAPQTSELLQYLGTNITELVLVGNGPVLSNYPYREDEVYDASDPNYFLVDDNNRVFGGTPFKACDQYYYFVTARDVLGRDGLCSTGTLITICDRVGPSSPKQLKVVNDYRFNTNSLAGDQRLMLSWEQIKLPDDYERNINYYVYRWSNQTDNIKWTHEVTYNRIAGPFPHIPGQEEQTYRDDQEGAPKVPEDAGKAIWYTVQAAEEDDCEGCAASWSGHSAPQYGVLRDRVGPDGGSGTLYTVEAEIVVVYHDAKVTTITGDNGIIPDIASGVIAEAACSDAQLTITQSPAAGTQVPPGIHPITVTVKDQFGGETSVVRYYSWAGEEFVGHPVWLVCTRTNSGVQWAEFYVGDPSVPENYIGRKHFKPNEDTVSFKVDYQEAAQVYCRAQSVYGDLSDFDVAAIPVLSDGEHAVIRFDALLDMVRTEGDTHIAHDPGSSDINPIKGEIELTPTTQEWKLYRRVDDADETLILQGNDAYEDKVKVAIEDQDLPPNASKVCYFLQLFDEHGNSGPFTRLHCIEISMGAEHLPVPKLLPLEPVGSDEEPQLRARWFCEPYGIERFHVYIGIASEEVPPAKISDALSTNVAPHPNVVEISLGGVEEAYHFNTYGTWRLKSPNFPDKPMFQTTFDIEPDKKYIVMIRAADATETVGKLSNAQAYEWSPGAVEDFLDLGANVPWPAKPKPPISGAGFEGRVMAKQLFLPSGFNGIGIRIGEYEITGLHCLDGTTNRPYFTPATTYTNPIHYLYKSTGASQKSLAPFVLYRSQKANAEYPSVSGELIQVSPLIESITYVNGVSPQFGVEGALLKDPFIAVIPTAGEFESSPCGGAMPDYRDNYTYDDCTEGDITITQSPEPGTYLPVGSHTVTIKASDESGNQNTVSLTHTIDPPPAPGAYPYEMYVLDTQPVLEGAEYRYFMVHFSNVMEIDQVIPIDTEGAVKPAL